MTLKQLLVKAIHLFWLPHRDYVIAAPGPDGSAVQLPTGTSFVPLRRELLEQNLKLGRISEYNCRLFWRLLQSGEYTAAIAGEDGELYGWSMASSHTPTGSYGGITASPKPGYAYIHDTFVSPEQRGRGLGTALNLKTISDLGKLKLFCLVRADNLPALRNWEKCKADKIAKITSYRILRGRWRHRVEVLADTPEAAAILNQFTFSK